MAEEIDRYVNETESGCDLLREMAPEVKVGEWLGIT